MSNVCQWVERRHRLELIIQPFCRRDLYLETSIVADSGLYDGELRQWASDTFICDLEIYNDPKQGVDYFLLQNEVWLVHELGECLWAIIQRDPFSAAGLLTEAHPALRTVARKLVERMDGNGRTLT